MKTKFFYAIVVGTIGLTLNFISCSEQENAAEIQKTEVLSEKTLLGDEIYLPSGTKWSYANKEKSEVTFELPEGYLFLIKNQDTGEFIIAPGGGGYSCTCSDSGSCTVFNNKQVGYGCLHSSCTGTCTGKRTKTGQTIEGVLIAENNQIDGIHTYEPASLSEAGKKGFFQVPEVKQEIKRTYDFIYKNYEKPDFKTLDLKNTNEYILASAQLYGFEIGIVIPNDENLKKLVPGLKIVQEPKNCSCSGDGNSCEFKKDCIFGYCAYYCSGCTTCTMHE